MARAVFLDYDLGEANRGLLTGRTAHLYDVGTSNNISNTIYSDATSGVVLANGWTLTTGRIRCYLDQTRQLDIVTKLNGVEKTRETVWVLGSEVIAAAHAAQHKADGTDATAVFGEFTEAQLPAGAPVGAGAFATDGSRGPRIKRRAGADGYEHLTGEAELKRDWPNIVGDGVADDTAQLQAMYDSNARWVKGSPGRYRVTSSLLVRDATYLRAFTPPGSSTSESDMMTIIKDFDGPLFRFLGVDGDVVAGAGGGLENIQFDQNHGNGTGESGPCIEFFVTSSSHKASWMVFRNLRMRVAPGKNHWEYGFYYDGSADSTNGARDSWIENCWGDFGSFAVAGFYGKTAKNVHIRDTFLNGAGGKILLTGVDTNNRSAGVRIIGGGARHLDCDWAETITSTGCSYTDLTYSANSRDCVTYGFLTNAPTIAGSRNYFFGVKGFGGTSSFQFLTSQVGGAPYDMASGLLIGTGTRISQHLSASGSLDFGSVNSGAHEDLTITVTGAALGDVVALGIPNASMGAAVTGAAGYYAWVSATNTVSVRFWNASGGALNPGAGTFRVDVWKH